MGASYLVSERGFLRRAIRLRDGRVDGLWVQARECESQVGNIFVAKVMRVVPGMNAAFLECGLSRTVVLYARGAMPDPSQPGRIEKLVTQNQILLVQVEKDALGEKGAVVSTRLRLAGHYFIGLPQQAGVFVSHKLSAERREALKAQVKRLMEEVQFTGGVIVRSSLVDDIDESRLRDELVWLQHRYQSVMEVKVQSMQPRVVLEEPGLVERLLRDEFMPQTDTMMLDTLEGFHDAERVLKERMCSTQGLERYRGQRDIFEHFGVEKAFDEAISPTVHLPSGGFLVINHTEALTTIDVNSGGFVGETRKLEDTVFKVNQEAVLAIAETIRLRNLSGAMVIDFIDMKERHHRDAIVAQLTEAVSLDREQVQVHPMTALGLVELTRTRRQEPLIRQLTEPCPHCQGLGRVLTLTAELDNAVRALRRAHKKYPHVKIWRCEFSWDLVRFLDDIEPKLKAFFPDIDYVHVGFDVKLTRGQVIVIPEGPSEPTGLEDDFEVPH